jgi:predicted N-acetyltransferase YhbS
VTALRAYQPSDLPGLADAWNECFAGGPSFVHVRPSDLEWRSFGQSRFDPRGVIVAEDGSKLVGFVHCGPRLNFRYDAGESRAGPAEGHIYVLVAPDDEKLVSSLLEAAESRLRAGGARRVLLGTSWIHGSQPFYNGLAGAYEIPGLGAHRALVLRIARARGYEISAEYGTPSIAFSDSEHLAALERLAEELRDRARSWRLRRFQRTIETEFFPSRELVELWRSDEIVATTAHGPWPEYTREYGTRVYGLTSVQVTPRWRGRGLGKLVVLEAIFAARASGAEGVHLHVWRGNAPAWNLYHRALGFRPAETWVTLRKNVP